MYTVNVLVRNNHVSQLIYEYQLVTLYARQMNFNATHQDYASRENGNVTTIMTAQIKAMKVIVVSVKNLQL